MFSTLQSQNQFPEMETSWFSAQWNEISTNDRVYLFVKIALDLSQSNFIIHRQILIACKSKPEKQGVDIQSQSIRLVRVTDCRADTWLVWFQWCIRFHGARTRRSWLRGIWTDKRWSDHNRWGGRWVSWNRISVKLLARMVSSYFEPHIILWCYADKNRSIKIIKQGKCYRRFGL